MKVKSVVVLLGRSKFSNLLFCDWILPIGRKLVVVKCSFGGELYMLCVDLQASERAREMCTYMYVARRMMTFEALRAWQIRERENESFNSQDFISYLSILRHSTLIVLVLFYRSSIIR